MKKISLKSAAILFTSVFLISCNTQQTHHGGEEEKEASAPFLLEIAAKTLSAFGFQISKQNNVLNKINQIHLSNLTKILIPVPKSIENNGVITGSVNFNDTKKYTALDSITGKSISTCGEATITKNNAIKVCDIEILNPPKELIAAININNRPLTAKLRKSDGTETDVQFSIVVKAFHKSSWCETDILAGKGYQNCITPIRRR